MRVELLAATAAGELTHGPYPADAECNFAELCELRDPCRERHSFPLQLARPTSAVPLLVRRAERLQHVGGEAKLLAKRSCDRRVVGDHVVHLAVTGERELKADPKAMQRRAPRSDPADPRHRGSHTAELILV